MTISVIEFIHSLSDYRIGFEGDVPTDEYSALLASATSTFTRLVGGRVFSAEEQNELKAYIVLDRIQNKHGYGTVVQEGVKDASWKVKEIATTSYWMDQFYAKLAEYDNSQSSAIDLSSTGDSDVTGVRRNDDYIPELMDGFVIPDEEEGW